MFYDNPLNNEKYNSEELFKYIKKYIDEKKMKGKNNIHGFLFQEKAVQITIITTTKNIGKGKWHIAEPEDKKDLKDVLLTKKEDIMNNLNKFIGFMGNFKSEGYVVFKVKNTLNKRDIGLRCDQLSSKTRGRELLNNIVEEYDGEEKYTNEWMEDKKNKQTLIRICIMQEFYLRMFENNKKNQKRWFLNPGESVLTNIDKKSVTK